MKVSKILGMPETTGKRPAAVKKPRPESAGAFLEKVVSEIQIWLRETRLDAVSSGKRWRLTASLSSGVTVEVLQLSAHGHSMLKLKGELVDGTPCLLIAHQQSVQLLADYTPREPQEPPKREVGFHTGIGKDINIEQ